MKLTGELATALLNAAPDPVIIIDDRGVIVFANTQVTGTFGYEPHELVGRPVEELLPARYRASHLRHRERFFGHPAPRPMGIGLELYAVHRDGREFPVEISLSPLETPEGVLVSCAVRDVSRQRETERKLADASRAKSRFLAAASHDLRQPLQALNLLNRAVARRVTDDELTASIVMKQQQALDSMTALLNSLLDISKLDAGGIVPKPVDCDSDDILERLRVNHEPQAHEKGLTLTIHGCGEPVHTDPDLLQQVLANLVSNAVRYTAKGSVRVSCVANDADTLRFEVADSGPGMPEDELDRIFDEFYQIDRDSRRPEGLGLGLSIVQRLGTLLGYALGVRSTVGEGTVFTVDVPRGTAPAEAEALAAGIEGAGGGYILIVDDERPVAEATKLLLEIEGFEVRLASCERDALAEVQARVPDLIISDFRLRGGETGLGVVKSVRRAANADVPVVFVTGDTSKLAVDAGGLPNAEFLAKPLQADELLTSVQRQIAASR